MAVHEGSWQYIFHSITVHGSTWLYIAVHDWICSGAYFGALLKALHCMLNQCLLLQVIPSSDCMHKLVHSDGVAADAASAAPAASPAAPGGEALAALVRLCPTGAAATTLASAAPRDGPAALRAAAPHATAQRRRGPRRRGR
jgi:hypothetical protein